MGQIRVADYIANFIEEKLGVNHVFLLTGGGNMHLTDGILKNKNITPICNHHEQACAMGAVGYAKQTGKIGVVMPTTGCAGTNTITGLLDAWQDSIPCFFISGQVNINQTCYKSQAKLRKFGTQEANILEVIKPLTKFSEMVDNPNDIRYLLEKAHYLSISGRPGPVWLDVPLNVQSSLIDGDSLEGYTPDSAEESVEVDFEFLHNSKRPIILAGNGIRLANAQQEFAEAVSKLNIPVVSTYLATDLLGGDNTNYVGRVGVKGDRAGNFALQNADLILAIGTSLSIPSIGYNYDHFGREAKLVVVDIDPEEHQKETVRIDKFVKGDAKEFITHLKEVEYTTPPTWNDMCQRWKDMWSYNISFSDSDLVDLYYFTKTLGTLLPKESSVVGDAGSAYYVPCQSLNLKHPQRLIVPGAQAEMGFTIPAAIGAYFGSPSTTIIGITGDGSFQFNVQELQTIKYYNIPIKLFVWNNNGYLSIRKTQDRFFNGDRIGTCPKSGVSFPDIEKITKAYGLSYVKINNSGECLDKIRYCIEEVSGPVVCEVMCDEEQEVFPTISAMKKEDGSIIGRPLEDMAPLLPRDEFYENMIISPLS